MSFLNIARAKLWNVKNKVTGQPQLYRTQYESHDIELPADFLLRAPKQPIKKHVIDFNAEGLGEYVGCYAVILDGVLSQQECSALLGLAERSVKRDGVDGPAKEPWQPAMVNAGPGFEILDAKYRNSDRIIWNQDELVQRLWNRCCAADGLQDDLKEVKVNKIRRTEDVGGKMCVETKEVVWKVTKLNERMRFLKYGPGQFFKPHCDSPYQIPGKDERTFYTFHFYLNDSYQELRKETSDKEASDSLCEGGATTFHSPNMKRRLDINPKAGRVLIFQHERLLHSGDDVVDGIKYTMRTDLQFEKVAEDKDSDTGKGLWEHA